MNAVEGSKSQDEDVEGSAKETDEPPSRMSEDEMAAFQAAWAGPKTKLGWTWKFQSNVERPIAHYTSTDGRNKTLCGHRFAQSNLEKWTTSPKHIGVIKLCEKCKKVLRGL